jgi:diaminohydroxyphosphoribosylaminopyrimidine deaminase/5-amino-6-(5-phosphoribosylamino)uracil reductase
MCGQLQSRIEVLQQQNSQLQVWRMPLDGVHERMDVHALWQKFYQQSYSEIHIEAGATVNGALLEAGLVDEIVMYLAPRIVGAGVPAALFDATTQLDKLATYDPHATDGWFWADAKSIDSDVRLTLRRQATV